MNSSLVWATQSANQSGIVDLAIGRNWASSRAPVFACGFIVTSLLQTSDSRCPMKLNQLVSIPIQLLYFASVVSLSLFTCISITWIGSAQNGQ